MEPRRLERLTPCCSCSWSHSPQQRPQLQPATADTADVRQSVRQSIKTGCCRVDNPSQDASLFQLRDPSSGAAEARTAFSGHRQQLRTDLTLRPLERCVEGLSPCGPSGAAHHANPYRVEAGHAPNGRPVLQLSGCTPTQTSQTSRCRRSHTPH